MKNLLRSTACKSGAICWIGDLLFTLATAALVAAALGIGFLNSPNSPTGGDAASHLLYAKLYADDLLFSGQIVPWVPEVFGGFPYLSYYFPLPFIVIAALSKITGLSIAFKWGSFLACMLLPGAVFTASRRWLSFAWQPAAFAGLGALAFLLHEQNSIWGGNLLSTLSGEFAYSYGILFAVLAMMAWARAIELGRGWILAALMEAASGFSHGFPLLVVGFSTSFLLLDGLLRGTRQDDFAYLKRSIFMLFCGHLLAFALLGGWLWPMIEMHKLTIPNDASFPVNGWQDLLPETLQPILAAGIAGLILLAFPSVRRGWNGMQRRALCYFISGAGLAAVLFIAGDQLGLADIRFFPLVWLLGAISCGWLAGQAVANLGTSWDNANRFTLPRTLLVMAAFAAMLGWFGTRVQKAPDWGLWNHSGLEAKPQWHNLSRLFPAMRGNLWTPRMTFEHDPDNNDLGSTRSLEALPMFLNHRPVMEGLYMESAVLGPAVYQLQSEISAQPSSPLVRFPSGSLDPQFAAKHMNFLHADTALIRSTKAKEALDASGLFVRVAEAPPYVLYRLKKFDSRMAEVVTQPLRLMPAKDWMQDAFAWFRNIRRFESFMPVYGDGPLPPASNAPAPVVQEKYLSRDEMVFETQAIGRPHLIKMAYHPRWQLASKGTLQIAGPGFMLVVPQEKEIRLVYGHTTVGKLGIAATLCAFAFLLWALWKRRTQGAAANAENIEGFRILAWAPIVAGWLFLGAAGFYFATHSPERAYGEAWDALRTNQFKEGAQKFLTAYQLRHPPAKKEEALFWMAKCYELAGMRPEAKARYQELIEHYHGFWVPESLYTYALLEELDGQPAKAAPIWQRLNDEYPNNQWNLRHQQDLQEKKK